MLFVSFTLRTLNSSTKYAVNMVLTVTVMIDISDFNITRYAKQHLKHYGKIISLYTENRRCIQQLGCTVLLFVSIRQGERTAVTRGQVSNIRRILIGNKIVDNSDLVGTSPVGAAPTTSSLST